MARGNGTIREFAFWHTRALAKIAFSLLLGTQVVLVFTTFLGVGQPRYAMGMWPSLIGGEVHRTDCRTGIVDAAREFRPFASCGSQRTTTIQQRISRLYPPRRSATAQMGYGV